MIFGVFLDVATEAFIWSINQTGLRVDFWLFLSLFDPRDDGSSKIMLGINEKIELLSWYNGNNLITQCCWNSMFACG